MMPLGLAVVPDVYSRYRSCSESMGSAGQSGADSAIRSPHHRSRPSVMAGSVPQRSTTITCSTVGAPAAKARSTLGLSGDGAPRR